MSNDIRANVNDIGAAGKNLADVQAPEFGRLVRDIYAAIEELKAKWQGAANEEFDASAEMFKVKLAELQQAISGYGEFLKFGARTIASTENDLAGSASNLPG